MSPGENIKFFLIGSGILIVIIIICFILRKRKKAAVTMSLVLVISYIGYYIYYPTLKGNTHAERYEQLEAYLKETYPEKQLGISPRYYEDGYSIGEFKVNDVEVPTMGVVYRVNREGQVSQTATWHDPGHPVQQELWRNIVFSYHEAYTLDQEIPEMIKKDIWIDGELTAFALTIDGAPSIAIYHYSTEATSLVAVKEGKPGEFVTVEAVGRLFIYIDENYQEEAVTVLPEAGQPYTLDTLAQKGRLIVKE